MHDKRHFISLMLLFFLYTTMCAWNALECTVVISVTCYIKDAIWLLVNTHCIHTRTMSSAWCYGCEPLQQNWFHSRLLTKEFVLFVHFFRNLVDWERRKYWKFIKAFKMISCGKCCVQSIKCTHTHTFTERKRKGEIERDALAAWFKRTISVMMEIQSIDSCLVMLWNSRESFEIHGFIMPHWIWKSQ